MKTPGPDHTLAFTQAPGRVGAKLGDHVVASTADALTLREADYDPVQYFPRADVEEGFLSRTDKAYTCPYKGSCVFYSILLDGEIHENVAWSYEAPYPAAEAIRGRIAFYTDRVQVRLAP